MNSTASGIRYRLQKAKDELKLAEKAVAELESKCQHKWGETEYTPRIEKGYTDPGDPLGTMGIDWRGPMYISGKTYDIWTRTCMECGKVEKTTNTVEKVERLPKF